MNCVYIAEVFLVKAFAVLREIRQLATIREKAFHPVSFLKSMQLAYFLMGLEDDSENL